MGAAKKLDRWKAVVRGKIFCAPACGGGCTLAEFNARCRLGRQLIKRLGKGWAYEVKENLGWHLDVISPCRRIRVSPHIGQKKKIASYMACLGDAGDAAFRYAEHAATAEKAIAAVIVVAKTDLKRMGAILVGLPVL